MKTNQVTSQSTTEQLEQRVSSLEKQNAELAAKIKWYEEQFRLSKQRQFGVSSEKTNSDQLELPLFNEVEISADPKVEEPTIETITYQRKKTKGERDLKFENLPKEVIYYELPADQQVCSCCQGVLHKMTTEVRLELKVIPAKVVVVEHMQQLYACRHCERVNTETPIVKARMPKPVFPKSLASPSVMAYVMNQKYVEGLPLYRQEQQLKRLGVSLSRQTIANWVLHGANTWLQLIFDRMYQHLMKRDTLHADETTLQVLREPGRAATATSYLWLYRSGQEQAPIVLFDYQQTRASKHPKKFLAPFKGYLHVDGYAGYHGIPQVKLVGCWAHARRKFDEALKALPEQERPKDVLAKQGLQFCNQLFAIEKEMKALSFEERYQVRLEKSRPILDAFSVWLRQQTPKVLPKSTLGQAIKYCRNQWEKLEAFLEDGRLEIDNNRSERSIKPFVIGRKNWIFANTPKGATASAVTYSIVETAKENGLNPYEYLKFLFEELPNMDTTDEKAMDAILPWSESLPNSCVINPNK